ncbi:ComEC/Rec2 family competence protein [Natrinema gari]|nr:MBL fold hydrolase [Natrinema gari]
MSGCPAQKIFSLDVGQADAKLVVSSDGTKTLIDADESKVVAELDRVFEEELSIDSDKEKTIDHFIATHLHQDHILGLFDLKQSGYKIHSASQPNLARFEVGEERGQVDPDLFRNYIEALSEHGIAADDINNLSSGDTIESVAGEILSPPAKSGTVPFKSPKTERERNLKPEKANENGLVIKLESEAGKSTLLMGDMQDSSAHHGEDWLVKQHRDGNLDLNADTLHIGHHGSDKATKDGYGDTNKGSFLSAVNPDRVVVSSELESEYSHPRDEVLDRLEEHGIDVFWTGVHGTIKQEGDKEAEIEQIPEIDAATPADILALKYYAKANDVTQEEIAALEEGSLSAEELPRDTPELAFKSDYLETASKASETIRRYPKDAERLTLNRFPKAMSTEYVSVDEHGAESTVADGNADDLSPEAQQVSQPVEAATEASLADIREQRQKALQRLTDTSPQSMSRSSQTTSTTSDQSISHSHTETTQSDQADESDKRRRK